MATTFIYQYEVSSFLFLLVTTVFFFLSRRLPGRLNRSFGIMLLLTMASLVLNTSTIFADNNAALLSLPFLYALNILALGTTNFSMAMFFWYTYLVTSRQRQHSRGLQLLVFTPIILLCLCLLFDPLTDWIFYFGEGHKYLHGKYHYFLYINACFYVLAIASQLYLVRRMVGRKIMLTIFCACAFMILAMAIQFLSPANMVTGTAGALAMVVLYNALQSPNEFLDPSTGVFNRAALPQLAESLMERRKGFAALLFIFRDYSTMAAIHGLESGRLMMAAFVEYIRANFNGSYIVRLDSNQFAVLLPDLRLDADKLQSIADALPPSWSAGNNSFSLSISLLGLNSADHSDLTSLNSSLEQGLQILADNSQEAVLFVDDKIVAGGRQLLQVERILRDKLNSGEIELCFQPIYSRRGDRYVSAEALARLYDDELGSIAPNLFIPIAERTGLINRLSELLLHQVCAFLSRQHPERAGLEHISINLSPKQCQDIHMAGKLSSILEQYNISPALICFEVTESAASLAGDNLLHLMEELRKKGVSFALDDFGTGYANLDSVIALPFDYAKVDKSLIWTAGSDSRKETLLNNIVNIFTALGIRVICEGAETKEHIELLRRNNVDMIQGYYYSQPITGEKLERLLELQAERGK